MAIEKSNKPTLHAVRDKRDAWKCSACGADFSGSKMQLVNSFGAHVRQQHKPAPKEDVNQAAARILREAAEGK